ncbi:MAG: hypothetical protein LBC48_06115 [Dysgonamonadaceae bacterium]|jgi:hypothetical protein|nr:hypothetical protein [Dysgonamonadaceae bacterium]
MKTQTERNGDGNQVKFISKYKVNKLKNNLSRTLLSRENFEFGIAMATGYRTRNICEIFDGAEYQKVVELLSDSTEGKLLRLKVAIGYIANLAFGMGLIYGTSQEDVLINNAVLRKVCREKIGINKYITEMNEDELARACACFKTMVFFRREIEKDPITKYAAELERSRSLNEAIEKGRIELKSLKLKNKEYENFRR